MTTCVTLEQPAAESLAPRRRFGPAALLSGVCAFTGLSNDSHRIASSTLDAAQSFLSVLSFPLPLDMEFAAKAQEWKSETEFCSSPEIAAGHPAYQRIIGMGPVVVPMILQEMRKEPGLWFDALMALTDEQPVLEAHAGDIVAMTQDWLEWGRRNGYLEG